MSDPFQLESMEDWLEQHHSATIPSTKSKSQASSLKAKPKKSRVKKKDKPQVSSRSIQSFFAKKEPVPPSPSPSPPPPPSVSLPLPTKPSTPTVITPVKPTNSPTTTTNGPSASWLALALEDGKINYHGAAIKDIVAYCQNAQRPPFLVLEGATGSGKSYSLSQAARQLRYQMNVLDPWEVPPHEESKKGQRSGFAQQLDMLAFQTDSLDEDARSSFVVCDAMDAWDKKRLSEFKTWSSFLLSAAVGKNTKKRKTPHRRVNPIIITVNSRYDPCIYALFGKVQTKFRHVKVATLDANKVDSIVRACCEATHLSPTRDLLLQVRQHFTLPDVSSSLTRAEFLCRFPVSSRMTRDMLHKDQVVGDDLFGSLNRVLRPSDDDWREDTTQHWHQGGERFFRIIFHSYPSFAPWVPPHAKADTKQEEYVEDMELLSHASDLYSRHDLMSEGRGNEEMEEEVLHRGMHQIFRGNIPATKRPTIDLKTYFPSQTPTIRLSSDGMDRVHYAMKMDDSHRAQHSDKANYLDKSYVIESCPFMSTVEMEKLRSWRQKHQQTEQAQKATKPRALPTGL